MTLYDTDHGPPKSSLGPYLVFLTFFMPYLKYNARKVKSTYHQNSEKMAEMMGGDYLLHSGNRGFCKGPKTSIF